MEEDKEKIIKDAEKKREEEKIKQIDKCLDQLAYYIDSMLTPPLTLKYYEDNKLPPPLPITEDWPVYGLGESIQSNPVIENHLFSLACYMRREDNREYYGSNNNLTDRILNGVRDIKKKLKGETGELKKLYKHLDRWLTKHNAKLKRNMFISSKKCGSKLDLQEEMPAYLLKAITKEKPVHPVYGNLRY